jgi:hypothetical protein
MMDQGVRGEAILGKPGAVEPEAMKGPLEKAGLHGGGNAGGDDGDRYREQGVPSMVLLDSTRKIVNSPSKLNRNP